MKRLSIILVLLCILLSFTACNKETKENNSQVQSNGSNITEKDIFEYNGTESEYIMTESQANQLFENQSQVTAYPSVETELQTDYTSSDKDSSYDSGKTNKFDKDGDGWTDEWK